MIIQILFYSHFLINFGSLCGIKFETFANGTDPKYLLISEHWNCVLCLKTSQTRFCHRNVKISVHQQQNNKLMNRRNFFVVIALVWNKWQWKGTAWPNERFDSKWIAITILKYWYPELCACITAKSLANQFIKRKRKKKREREKKQHKTPTAKSF